MSKKTVDADGVVSVTLFGGPVSLKPRPVKETRTPCGEPFIYRADLSYDVKGHKKYAVGQKLDLDAMIQAALPSTDIAAIVARAKMGDDSVLHVNPGFVGDSVNLPKDLYDYKAMNDLYDKVSASFETLPDGVKALFDNDSSKYLNSIINGSAESIVKTYNSQQAQAAEGVKENA